MKDRPMPITSRPLTHRAEEVIRHAANIAGEMGMNYTGTEHILLGLLREGDGIAVGVLEKFKVTEAKAKAAVRVSLGMDARKKAKKKSGG